MLRSEFDSHPLWATISQVKEAIDALVTEHEPAELAKLETVRFYATHAESFRELATTACALFSAGMLTPVNNVFDAVLDSLNYRVQNGNGYPNYVDQAAQQAETSLIPMGPWPRPYGKGGQVNQINTLYEDLLEAQRKSVAALVESHGTLRAEVTTLDAEVLENQRAALADLAELKTEATAASVAINSEKGRIDEVVKSGLKSVADIETNNTERYKTWQAEREASFKEEFNPLKDAIEADLASAREALNELKETNRQFENLSTVAAGETMAANFRDEAKWGRRTGITLYALGALFIASAAVPLIFLLFDANLDSASGPRWGLIFVRLALGILAGSAATVVIRLGGRLIANADLSKRMELELRAIGPFLANVYDTTLIDGARLGLVERSFGKSYEGKASEATSDGISVSVLAQVVELISKAVRGSNGP